MFKFRVTERGNASTWEVFGMSGGISQPSASVLPLFFIPSPLAGFAPLLFSADVHHPHPPLLCYICVFSEITVIYQPKSLNSAK